MGEKSKVKKSLQHLTAEQMANWKQNRADGWLKWYVFDGLLGFLCPLVFVLLVIINPLVMGTGLSYFTSQAIVDDFIIILVVGIPTSVIQSLIKWRRANMAYLDTLAQERKEVE